VALFSESSGRLIVELEQRNLPAFMKVMNDQLLRLGTVNDADTLELPGVAPIPVATLADAFATPSSEAVGGQTGSSS
jgi:phosphoribosylformylglycinamidine synthase